MATELDKLFFSLDADLTPLQAKFAAAEASALKSGAAVSAAFKGQTAATAAATAETTAYAAAAKEGTKATENMHGAATQAAREFRALFDELSSGRTRQTPGTLAIIANRVFGIQGATLGMVAAFAAVPAVILLASSSVQKEMEAINVAIKATGDQAGVTTQQLLDMANAAAGNGLTQGQAIGAATAFVRGGATSPQAIQQGLALVKDWAQVTGQDATKAATDLARAMQDPIKAAQDWDKSLNFLNDAELQEIKNLQQQGDLAGATARLYQDLGDRIKGTGDQLGYLGRAWNSVKGAFSSAWQGIGSLGSPQTPEQQLAAAKSQLELAQSTGVITVGGVVSQVSPEMLKQMTDEVDRLTAAVKANQDQAKQDQSTALERLLGKQAGDLVRQLDDVGTKQTELVNNILMLTKAWDAGSISADDARKSISKAIVEIGAADPQNAIARQIKAIQEETSAYSLNAVQRQHAIDLMKIEQQYRDNLADPNKYQSAGAIRSAQLANLSAREFAPFGDLSGPNGPLQSATLNTAALQRYVNAGPTRAGRNQASAYNRALNSVQPLQNQATAAAQSGNLDLYNKEQSALNDIVDKLTQQYEIQDQLDAQAKAQETDLKLEQENEQLKTQLDLMHQSAEERAKAIADIQTKNELMNEGWTQDMPGYTEELQKLQALNAEHAKLTLQIEQEKKAQQEWQNLTREFTSDLTTDLSDLVTGTKTLSQAFTDLGNQIAKMILQAAIMQPLQNSLNQAFGGTGSSGASPVGGGGIWNSLFSSIFSSGSSSAYSSLASTSLASGWSWGFAAGGQPNVGEPTLVGEQGPEIFVPSGPGTVVSNQETKRIMGGSAPQIHLTQQISVHPDVSAVARQQVLSMMPVIQQSAVRGVQQATKRGQLDATGRGAR